jgi:hypothetical protein
VESKDAYRFSALRPESSEEWQENSSSTHQSKNLAFIRLLMNCRQVFMASFTHQLHGIFVDVPPVLINPILLESGNFKAAFLEKRYAAIVIDPDVAI